MRQYLLKTEKPANPVTHTLRVGAYNAPTVSDILGGSKSRELSILRDSFGQPTPLPFSS